MHRLHSLLLALSLGGIIGTYSLADDAAPNGKAETKPSADSTSVKDAGPSDPKEEAAIEFAQRNHPALVPLLQALKTSSPNKYREAIVALNKDIDRLGGIRERNAQRYSEQLAEWKITSRIQLLGARLAVSDDSDVETELAAALRERVDLKLANAKAELDRLKKREKKLNSMIEELSDKDKQVAKELAQLKSASPVPKGGKKKLKSPTAAGQVDSKGGNK